jgi:hypothetical protein
MSHDNPNSDWKIDDKVLKQFSTVESHILDTSKFLTDSAGNRYPIYNTDDLIPKSYQLGIATNDYSDRTINTVYTGGTVTPPWDQVVDPKRVGEPVKTPVYTMGTPLEPRSFARSKKPSTDVIVQSIDIAMYLKLLNIIPIVHKAYVIYEDLPNEISVRVEMLANTKDVDSTIIDDAQHDLTAVFQNYRIKDCNQINVSLIYTEVII